MLALTASFVLAAGCGGGDDEPPDPEAPAEAALEAGRGFIHQVAAGDPVACDRMTSNAVRQAKVTGGAPTCEEAVEERKRYLRFSFDGASTEDLTAELAAGRLLVGPDGPPKFRFCLPSETQVTVRLVEGDSGWQVDGVGAGSRYAVTHGGEKTPAKCNAR